MILVDAGQVAYSNEIVELTKVFFPGEEVADLALTGMPDPAQYRLLLECGYKQCEKGDHGSFSFYARLSDDRTVINETVTEADAVWADKYNGGAIEDERRMHKEIKNRLKGCVYDLLSSYTGHKPKWGILTGIRPVKIVNQMIAEGISENSIRDSLTDIYKLHPSKTELLIRTAAVQRPYVQNKDHSRVSVYIHIPICATKCLYCSFPSDLIGRVSDKIGPYLDCMEMELSSAAKLFREKGIQPDSVYIGGGTPTVLDYPDFKRLLDIVGNTICSGNSIIEYTVEAGRPDSLDSDKLKAMKEFGVTRLSINPQSMNQRTLDLIGRSHSVDDIHRIYSLARQIGFDNINMDVIAGLPEETAEDFEHTMKEIAKLNPDNITMHTLAVKRASRLRESFRQYDASREGLAEEMADICDKYIDSLGMRPYYLYRQKYMLDHLENIGYSLPGKECIYNIHIMDEKRSIWAFGAGAASKIYYPSEDRVERLANVKNIAEYIGRIQEMISKKEKVLSDS